MLDCIVSACQSGWYLSSLFLLSSGVKLCMYVVCLVTWLCMSCACAAESAVDILTVYCMLSGSVYGTGKLPRGCLGLDGENLQFL